MKRVWWFFGFYFAAISSLFGVQGIYLNPDIYRDQIVFESNGRLWITNVKPDEQRCIAYPIHDIEGLSLRPKFSPDGKKIVFYMHFERSASAEVYVMDLETQDLQRLTYEGVDTRCVLSWFHDKVAYVGFNPQTAQDGTLKCVDLVTKQIVEPGVTQCSHAIGDEGNFCFVRFGEQSAIQCYRGGQLRRLYEAKKTNDRLEIGEILVFPGANCFSPVVCYDMLYFLSDISGKNRLYRWDGEEAKEVFHDSQYSIGSISSDGHSIVLEVAGTLKLYTPSTGIATDLEIDLFGTTANKGEWVCAANEIFYAHWKSHPLGYFLQETLATDPEGIGAIFLVRGNLIGIRRGEAGYYHIEPPKGGYYFDVAVSQKGIAALYGTKHGIYLHLISFSGTEETYFLTTDYRSRLLVSLDGRFVATTSAQNALFVFDCETKEEREIDQQLFGYVGKEGCAFSPDGKWLAYSIERGNQYCSLRLCHLESGECSTLTERIIDAVQPVWHPQQAAIYFLDRNVRKVRTVYTPGMPKRVAVHRPQLCALSFTDEDPFDLPTFEETVSLEEKTFSKRVYRYHDISGLDTIVGTKRGLICDGLTSFFLSFVHGEMEEQQSCNFERIYTHSITNKGVTICNGDFYWSDFTHTLSGALEEEIDLPKHWTYVDLAQEGEMLFYAVHRVFKSCFYDRTLGDNFWHTLKARYQPLLTRVQSRRDLLQVISWMLGELNTMHIFLGGPFNRKNWALEPVDLPLHLTYDAEAKGMRVVAPISIDPLWEMGQMKDYAEFLPGDLIQEVNHRALHESTDWNSHLVGAYATTAHFSILRNGQKFEIEAPLLHCKELQELWVHDWAYKNRLFVAQQSEDRIGYIHLNGMQEGDLQRFAQLFSALSDCEALILDLRYNHGGNIHQDMIELIGQELDIYETIHGVRLPTAPHNRCPNLVVLCNQYTASDGEVVISLLKKRYPVTVIGTKTWGGGVGIAASLSFMPGGTIVTVPAFGMHDRETGQVIVERVGAEPIDIYVDQDPLQQYSGEDPQLAKALDILLRREGCNESKISYGV